MSKQSRPKGRFELSCLLLVLLCSPLQAEHGDYSVHIYNWEAFMAPSVINNLKLEHRIEIEQLYFSDEAVRDELLLSERGKTIDIVVIESVRLQALSRLGVVRPITSLREKLSSRFDAKWMDACGDYGIPYAWGTSGILYRHDKVTPPISSWRTLLEPADSLKGRVSMYYHPIDLIGAALLASNKHPFSEDEVALQSAHKLLKSQRSYLGTTNYILNEIGQPENLKNIDIAFGFSGDHHALNRAESSVNWSYVVPKEGTIVWLECLAIPSGSRFHDKTLFTLDYLTSPEVAALNAEESWFSTPNKDVRAFLSQQYLDDPVISPESDLIEKSFIYSPVSDSGLLLRQRIVEDLR
ncbi:predicted polyamine sensor NspS [Vibrio maritimus]|uniref:Predicted polyamine sensor NspS n=1 Tax=Vibrio maritimus TaxID=990268 RepID=A0A090TLA6_9VIBR|nr:predicted polyamine sensor NspS [Vibrio maritimus]